MKRLVLEQFEKNKILEMYGLVTEEELDTELINYANNYIDNTDCDQIYNDMTKALQAATSGQLPMSDGDKKELESNLKNLGLFKSAACKLVKQTMKTTFEVQSKQNPEKLKTLMCWFSVNVRPPDNGQPLKSCAKTNIDNKITSTADTQINNQVVVNPQATGNTQSSGNTQTQIDYNLDTQKKIQDFQTWMDKKGKWAWSKKYQRWYDVRGRVNYGFGRLGPNTIKNWEKYKNDYLKEIGIISDKKDEVKKDENPKNEVNKDQVNKKNTELDLGSEKKDESGQNLGSEEQKISTTDF